MAKRPYLAFPTQPALTHPGHLEIAGVLRFEKGFLEPYNRIQQTPAIPRGLHVPLLLSVVQFPPSDYGR